jgi:hypothetical protein
MDVLPAKTFDTSGKSAARFHYRTICKIADGAAHRALGAITGQKSRQLKLHPLATANDRLRVARTARACHPRARGEIDVNTVPDLNKTTPMAATG